MDVVEVRFCCLMPEGQNDITMPGYQSAGAAGMDIAAAIDGQLTLQPGERVLIPTGYAVAIPAGCELQVRPRSGLAIRHGITVINSPGTIDSDYRGEIKIGLINLGQQPYTIHRGERIAQLVLAPVLHAVLRAVPVLDETARGTGGFGHTGRC